MKTWTSPQNPGEAIVLNLNLKEKHIMAKTQSPATIIAQACAALAQVSQQLAAVVQLMDSEGAPAPKAAAAKVAEPENKPPVQFTAQEIEKIKLLMSCGEEKNSAMRKVFNLRGGKKVAAPAKAAPTVKVAAKAAPKIKMITRENVENDSYKLSEFTAHLKENGIEKDSESWNAFKAKFLELRKKFKDEIEEENSVPEEPEMSADDQLMGEFATDETGGFGGFDYTE